ncbi:hypothetical protein [Streptomyces sp. NPDC049040]|uniref:hypothetical protein n=1 Tax=Streptomyces sp. NPDC049040 TaxID=3365593 RepID=UPI00372396DD
MEQLPEGVDRDIMNHRIILPTKAIREARACTLHEALDVSAERYEELRRDRPDSFAVSPEDHGRGFYSSPSTAPPALTPDRRRLLVPAATDTD